MNHREKKQDRQDVQDKKQTSCSYPVNPAYPVFFIFFCPQSVISVVKYLCWLFLALSIPLESSQDIQERVSLHLCIHDPQSALAEVEKELLQNPASPKLLRLQVQCLSNMNTTLELIQAWNQYYKIKDQKVDRELLEEVSWAIIRNSSTSDSPIIRCVGAVAAFLSNDAKGIPICSKALQDINIGVRLEAVSLAAHMRDESLQKQVLDAFLHDPSPQVRQAAIASLGMMRVKSALQPLKETIAVDTSTVFEKLAAVEACANIIRAVDASVVRELASSKRAFLRALACELVLVQLDPSTLSFIEPCMNDVSPDVRLLAIQCMGIVGSQKKEHSSFLLSPHRDVQTSIAVNWLFFLIGEKEEALTAEENLKKRLFSSDKYTRLLAAAALAHTGEKGLSLAQFAMQKSDDPHVRINLAIYLIWQRKELKTAAETLAKSLSLCSERIAWHDFGVFSYVAPSKAIHVQGYDRVPETEDLLTRLDLYSMLATCGYKELGDILRSQLREHTWGITGQTASLMIQEGMETPEALKELLNDPSMDIAVQAAFLLALYSQDMEALKVLEKQYHVATRAVKERILYAIGSIGASEALPFLIQALEEPFVSLRLLAAHAILQCLSH